MDHSKYFGLHMCFNHPGINLVSAKIINCKKTGHFLSLIGREEL